MRRCFCSKFCNFGTIFAAAFFMLKHAYIAWHETNNMPTSSATSLIVIRRLSKIISFTASMFSSLVEVLGRKGWPSSFTYSRPSLNRLYQNWICVLLLVYSPNATVNISNVLARFILFFTQNLIQFFEPFFRIVRNRKAHQKYDDTIFLSVTNTLIIQNGWHCQHYLTNMCTNITEKKWALNICNPRNFKITIIYWSHLVHVCFTVLCLLT